MHWNQLCFVVCSTAAGDEPALFCDGHPCLEGLLSRGSIRHALAPFGLLDFSFGYE